ncbi:MAG: GDSL-type esterase/lipase family protein [Acidobacteriota bacterium]|nr:GDSL-type esterase/lipase family protein [Acidobacteriota bacterium]
MKRLIVAMGDSTTAGTPGWKSRIEAPPAGSGEETSQYAWWLMRDEPDWDVLNHGVNGERSDQIRARFERDVIDHKPSTVVVIAGVNDVYQGRDAAHVIEQLSAMYSRAAEAKIAVVAGTIVPYNTATAEQNSRMRQINDWIRTDASRDLNVTLVDTRAAVAAPGDPDRLFDSPDGLHPSPDGYKRMAAVIRAAIKQLR